MGDPRADAASASVDELYRRPGFLLRRAHQISVALFLEETAGFGLTTAQYCVMVALRSYGGLKQASLAKMIGIDRSTSALVVSKLETAGYVVRSSDMIDARSKIVTLTRAGDAMLDRAAEPAQRARQRGLDIFSTGDAAKFLALLERFVGTFNACTRAPIDARLREERVQRS